MSTRKKQIRRTSTTIDIELTNALKEQVENVGFANITLKDLIAKANMVPSSFYKRFPNMDALLNYFVQSYDFWFTNIAEFHETDNVENYYKETLSGLADSLYKNKVMQKLLLWELTDDNPTTRRTAQKREDDCKDLTDFLDDYFHQHHIEDARAITTIIIAGIYYIILHKERSTFCGINFNTNEGKDKLLRAIDVITSSIFGLINSEKNTPQHIEELAMEKANKIAITKFANMSIDQAKEMKADGFTDEQIMKYTKLPASMVDSL